MGMEIYDLSIFSTLALHISYEEFKQKYLNHLSKEKKTNFYSKNSVLPIICSECPGWVCYAEKRCGELALPHMSTSKSPQQIFGNLMHMEDINCKVVCIMPCYDKKLEAVRPDFKFAPDDTQVKEVDSVLATHEIIDLLNKKGVQLFKMQECEADEEMTEEKKDEKVSPLDTFL